MLRKIQPNFLTSAGKRYFSFDFKIMPKKKRSRQQQQQNYVNRITFLGTASMAPLPLKRNVSSMVFSTTSGNLYMIDCGEGTKKIIFILILSNNFCIHKIKSYNIICLFLCIQHQLKLSLLRTSKLHTIFLTHLHGDHCYGIFGLLHR